MFLVRDGMGWGYHNGVWSSIVDVQRERVSML